MHMLITSLQVPICFVSILDFWGEKNVFQKRSVWSGWFFLMGFFIFAIHQAYVGKEPSKSTRFFFTHGKVSKEVRQKCNTYLRRKRKHGVS